MFTSTALQVFDARKGTVVENVPLDTSNLVSPLKPLKANGDTSNGYSVSAVAHSVRVYKGKIFLLVSTIITDIR